MKTKATKSQSQSQEKKMRQSENAQTKLDTEFGILDSSGLRKENILDAFLTSKILYVEDLSLGIIFSPNKSHTPYNLITDSPLRSKLYNEGKASCLISFQRRTDGCFAVARLWDIKRMKDMKEKGEKK